MQRESISMIISDKSHWRSTILEMPLPAIALSSIKYLSAPDPKPIELILLYLLFFFINFTTSLGDSTSPSVNKNIYLLYPSILVSLKTLYRGLYISVPPKSAV